jgi:putative membrane-bound dehydrogenase-like protein
VVDASHPAAGAKGFDSALSTLRAPTRNTKPLKADEAIKQFQTREGLAVDLIAAEPVVRQPLNIQFDERGRMWVTNYAQYPFPKGLKVVEYDRYIRAKFDKVPAPPPKHDRGEDKVTIHEDGDGDGTFEKVGTFVDGLNIVTSALPGRGGVWVLNPPYLLFYPDKDRDDVPDGDPVVHLSGFGLEDTHSVASSLMWGPDGWIYGAHGSTVTAKVKAELSKSSGTTDFLGQAIWRYHPERHVFELFAEGGGNTFGVEFDDKGRVFSGTNWGQYRGLHYVQGGYYIKGWGKHGPLTNPHAYGNFEHMPHSGNADRLTHTYIVYGGTLLKDLRGKIVGPNSLMSRVDVTRLEANASTFKTVEEEDLLVSRDGWFRPVDLKAGPDGAIYIADFYEDRISHVDPRDNWERSSGRIYRVRPKEWKAAKGSGDLAGKPSAELVELLKSEDRWHRQTAMRLLHDRRDASVAPALREMLLKGQGQTALEALWGLNAAGALDEASGIAGLSHGDPHVRAWTIRLLADGKAALPEAIAKRFVELASGESDATVRSQMASSAKRLPAEQGMMIVRGMLAKDDSADPHIPLLLWWAVESKSVSDREAVLSVFAASDAWQSAVARGAIFPRLARRYAADGSPENQQALLRLLSAAPGDAERAILLSGVRQALDGTAAVSVSAELSKYFVASGDLELAARAGDLAAHSKLLELARDESSTEQERVRRVALLGQLARPGSGEVLLELVAGSKSAAVRRAAMQGLKHFDEPAIGQKIVAMYPALDAEIKAAAIGTLTTRANGIVALLKGVEAGVIAKEAIGPEHRARIADQEDKAIEPLAVKVLGQLQRASSAEKEREVERIRRIVSAGGGDTGRGETTFTERCAGCHALHGKGAKIAPDLTPYDRSSLDFLLLNTIDPSSYIRDEYTQFRIKTRDKQTLYGLVSERNATHVTITDSGGQRTTIPRSNIADERGLATSIMPEGLLEGLNDQQLRDLVAYLQKK